MRTDSVNYLLAKPYESLTTREKADVVRELITRQNGCCKVCELGNSTSDGRKLVLDHDHLTGRIRDMLCTNCNVSLGLLREDPEHIRRLIEYVEGHAGKQVVGRPRKQLREVVTKSSKADVQTVRKFYISSGCSVEKTSSCFALHSTVVVALVADIDAARRKVG